MAATCGVTWGLIAAICSSATGLIGGHSPFTMASQKRKTEPAHGSATRV